MQMATDYHPGIQPLEFPCHVEIVQDRRIHRIMIDEYGLFARFLFREPFHSLARNQARSHSHVRTAVAADETPATCPEKKVLISEDILECPASALRPVGIVIALNYVNGPADGVSHRLGKTDFVIRAEIGDIPSEDYEIQ